MVVFVFLLCLVLFFPIQTSCLGPKREEASMTDGLVFLQLGLEAGRRQFARAQGHVGAHGLSSGYK